MSKRNSLLSSEHADPPKQYADDPEVVHDGFDKQAYTPEEPKYLAPNQDPPEVDERQPLEPDQNYRDSTYPHYADQSPRTICGLRRKTFIILSAIIALLIILGVGLGAGLGVGLKKSSTNDSESANSSPTTSNPKSNTKASPLRVIENTGLALTPLADGTGLLLYYQLPNKTIIEAFHPNTSLTSTSLTNSSANSPLLAQSTTQIPTPNILQASPLTAVSFLRNGLPFRALFYISNDGLVQTTNSTSLTAPWSSPAPIDSRVATSGTPALATCYFPGAGLRLYYGQSDGAFITKLENGFERTDGSAADGWHDDITLEQISAQGGVACTGMYERGGKMVEDVYTRNVSSVGANVVHMVDNVTDTIFVPIETLANTKMRLGDESPMTIAMDGNRTRSFLFYRGQDDQVRQVNTLLGTDPRTTQPTYNTWDATLGKNAKIAAAWVENGNDGPVVVYETSPGRLGAVVVNWNGAVTGNGTFYA